MNIDSQVNDLVLNIRGMIDNINYACQGVDESIAYRVDEVKNKAVSVLNMASDRVIASANTLSDVDEIMRGVEIVREKSRVLYENAIKKIDSLKNEVTSFPQEQVSNNVPNFMENQDKNDVENFLGQQLNNTITQTTYINNVSSNNSEAVRILRTWLKPEVY